MLAYKLTDENMMTYGNCKWDIGVEKTTSGIGELCTSGWLHCYSDPILAIMLNPIHASFKHPKLFRTEVGGAEKHDRGMKSGYSSMTLLEELPLPIVTTEQRVIFAILCARSVCPNPKWTQWADNWLSGKDRTIKAAAAAAAAAAGATTADATAAAYAAAAAAAAEATIAAAYAADVVAADATAAAYAAEAAAAAAAAAAEAAAEAAAAAYAAEAAAEATTAAAYAAAAAAAAEATTAAAYAADAAAAVLDFRAIWDRVKDYCL